MELLLTLDIDVIRVEMKPAFTSKYKSNWVDQENPTDVELKESLKDEVNVGLRYLGISEDMFEIVGS